MTDEDSFYKIMVSVFNYGRKLDWARLFSNDLSVPEFIILIICVHKRRIKENVFVSDVVREFEGSAPAISKHLRTCEGKGYIVRLADKTDRRNTVITITDRGEKTIRESLNELDIFRKRLFKKIPMNEFMEWLEKACKFRKLASETLLEMEAK